MEDLRPCVFLLKSRREVTLDLREAQEFAINENCPLIVLENINPKGKDIYSELRGLIQIEEILKLKNIALITLIDQTGDKLAAALQSLKPVKIFMDENFTTSEIIEHPVSWNGEVLGVKDLLKLSESELCL